MGHEVLRLFEVAPCDIVFLRHQAEAGSRTERHGVNAELEETTLRLFWQLKITDI